MCSWMPITPHFTCSRTTSSYHETSTVRSISPYASLVPEYGTLYFYRIFRDIFKRGGELIMR